MRFTGSVLSRLRYASGNSTSPKASTTVCRVASVEPSLTTTIS